jgi:N-acetylneuraminic acid mutarotase
VVNGKIYAIGGFYAGDLSGIVEEYDPVIDVWTRKADMPTPRWWLSTSAVNGKIYAIGGADDSFLATVEEYDPETDTWTRKADMPIRRAVHSTSVVNGKIYVIGGASDMGAFLRPVGEYDPATDAWTQRADIPTPRGWLSTSVVNGKVYAIGGCVDVHDITFSTVEEYNPEMDIWIEKTDMPTPRKAFATSVVNGKIYAIGGSTQPDWNAGSSTVEQYEFLPQFPDFNGDGLIDIKDLARLIESWGQDDPIVDIAPPPFGDGVVDEQDLAVFMVFWGQIVTDRTLIAHWPLDETQGDIAYDSVSVCDGILNGNPVWQPDGGMVTGALQFDGFGDYVSTDPVLNPAYRIFSVIAWIKGGAPGQIILSQMNGTSWLQIDSTEGYLMTGLKLDRSDTPLVSQTCIIDGTWHRIGFVWDGLFRHLYVDGIEVATDVSPLSGLASAEGGLYFGAGCTLAPGSFFSGLIDDVRIYNRAVNP